ncbi:MAG: hypothetical protein LBM94_05350 [Propionibacteriaceae bacterium]|nr:hypothetical protein [Propionibacteriaceae bacterium]
MSIRSVVRRVGASAEIVSIHIASYVPVQAFRILVLRLWGARIGRGVAISHGLTVRGARALVIEDDVYIAESVVLDARGGLSIGASTSINAGAQLWSAQHDWQDADFAYVKSTTSVGHHCWICSRAVVLPGVSVGNGTVVGAGAVVSTSLPEWHLAVGVPAAAIRERPKGLQYRLMAHKNKPLWW